MTRRSGRVRGATLWGMPGCHAAVTKVCEKQADILAMDNKHSTPFGPQNPQYLEARALALSIAAIRKAQGKRNPVDYAVGSPDWETADEEFARDILRILGSQ
jgi:hypothetical protein